MANSYTSSGLIIQVTGENSGTWGNFANTNFQLTNGLATGFVSIALTSTDVTVPSVQGVNDQGKNTIIRTTGLLTASVNLILPTVSRRWTINNTNTGAFTLTVKTVSGTGIVVPQGTVMQLYCDGANILEELTAVQGPLTLGTALPISSGGTGGNTQVAAQTALGLLIGTNVQAYNANTAFTNAVGLYTQQQNFAMATLTDAATITWNLNTQQVGQVSLAGNRTLANPTNQVAGATYILFIRQTAGNNTLSYSSAYHFNQGTPVLSTAAGAIDILTAISDGTVMYASLAKGWS